MPRHEHRTLRRHVVGHAHRLFGIAGVVADDELQLLAQHAALGVNVSHHFFGAALELVAEGGLAAGHGSGHADDDDIGGFGTAYGRGSEYKRDKRYGNAVHERETPVEKFGEHICSEIKRNYA